jgi:hypothetical protein
LAIPELVFANLDEAFGRNGSRRNSRPLQGSQGLNLACIFLSGAINLILWLLLLMLKWRLK